MRHDAGVCIFPRRIFRVAERAAESATAIARSRPLADKGRQKAEMRNANGIPFSALSSFTGSDKKIVTRRGTGGVAPAGRENERRTPLFAQS